MIKLLRSIVLLFVVIVNAHAQEVVVSGKVTSGVDGGDVPGVSIRINNSNQGTVTDVEGNYQITASPTDTLLFTFIGFDTAREVVGDRTTINVVMQEESTELGEVVITGFQEVQRKLFTGSAANVKM